jgi:tetraprenyl-beta-curcumene synthase
MSTAVRVGEGRIAQPRSPALLEDRPPTTTARAGGERALARAFAQVVSRHVLRISPLVSREVACWRTRADEISSPELRRAAQQALAKRGNIEGAALFAVLAPARRRRTVVRALVAFQTAYNYLDGLSELPSEDPIANTRQLHEGLVAALRPGGVRPGGYAHDGSHDDGGYLTAILNACGEALEGLPSYPAFAEAATAAAARIVDFQALNLGEGQGGHGGLRDWAIEAAPPHTGLAWWETAVASGSSLAVHALIAAAANPGLRAWQAREIDRVYFPWIGALHSLLDSLVDRHEDLEGGRPCFLDYYDSTRHAAERLASLAHHGLDAAAQIPDAPSHRMIATAMCSYYLSAPGSDAAEAQTVADRLSETFGLPLDAAVALFRARRFLHTLTRRVYV